MGIKMRLNRVTRSDSFSCACRESPLSPLWLKSCTAASSPAKLSKRWSSAPPSHSVLSSFHSSCLWKTVSSAARWSGTCSCQQTRWTRSFCKTLHAKRPCSRSSDRPPVGGAHWEVVLGWAGGGDGVWIILTEKDFFLVLTWCRWWGCEVLFVELHSRESIIYTELQVIGSSFHLPV